MLIFANKCLTLLATPKTGTTSLEAVLRPKADIIFARQRKHMNAQRYTSKVAPFLSETFGIETQTCALMRAPVDQMRSWYKYRARNALVGTPRSTRGISFDDFIVAAASDTPPEFARIGSQHSFVTDDTGRILVDHLFAYEHWDRFLDFLTARLGTDVQPERRNVSPAMEAPISDGVLDVIRAKRAEEFALYEELAAAGGYLACSG